MGDFVTTRRVRLDGTRYAAGDPIAPDAEEAKRLEGMGAIEPARSGSGGPDAAKGDGDQSQNGSAPVNDPDGDRLAAIAKAVADLKPDDFKQDGAPRAATLKALAETLGFEVTDEDVATAQKSGETAQN